MDFDRARRRLILTRAMLISGGFDLLICVLLLIFGNGLSEHNTQYLVLMGGLLAVAGVAWVLIQMQREKIAAHLFFLSLILPTIWIALHSAVLSPALATLFIPIVGANLLLSPRWSFGYAGVAFVAFLLSYVFGQAWVDAAVGTRAVIIVLYASYFVLIALLAALATSGYQQQVEQSRQHALELEEARATLEQRVEERTSEMRQAMADLQRSSEIIRQMSVPIMPVADGVLALPLIGSIDSQRAEMLSRRLLDAVFSHRAQAVLIDITGVPLVDTQVAAVILQATQAIRMLGAEPVLVGIRAEVAHTIVGLGVDMHSVVTQRDLQGGLAYIQEKFAARQQSYSKQN